MTAKKQPNYMKKSEMYFFFGLLFSLNFIILFEIKNGVVNLICAGVFLIIAMLSNYNKWIRNKLDYGVKNE